VIYLQTTKNVRDELGLGRAELAEAGDTDSKLGNWLVNVVPMAGRYAFLFVSNRSLLSFPILIGQKQTTAHDMPNFLAHGVSQLLPSLGIAKSSIATLVADFDEVALCKASDKSALAIHAAIASDYLQTANRVGKRLDFDAIIHEVNSRPRSALGWRLASEVAQELLAASEA
jgi:hypothetical protein